MVRYYARTSADREFQMEVQTEDGSESTYAYDVYEVYKRASFQ